MGKAKVQRTRNAEVLTAESRLRVAAIDFVSAMNLPVVGSRDRLFTRFNHRLMAAAINYADTKRIVVGQILEGEILP